MPCVSLQNLKTCAYAMSKPQIETIYSQRAAEPVGPYPHAKRVGNLLFLCGMGPRRRGQKEIPGAIYNEQGEIVDYDIVEQAKAVFENIRLVLEEAGVRWEDIVDVTVFLTNMKRDFAAFNQVYKEYFGEVQPTRTTVEVGALPTPIAVELKVIAVVE